MKTVNKVLGLVVAIAVMGFVYVWLFVPDTKQDIEDWWFVLTNDCVQMHAELINDQECKISDDCELNGKESKRADKLEEEYLRHCVAR
jgi:hypothetical protein